MRGKSLKLQKNRDGAAVSSRLCSRYAGMGLAVYMNGAKAVETARKDPHKKQNPTHMAWCSHRCRYRWLISQSQSAKIMSSRSPQIHVVVIVLSRSFLSFLHPYYMQFQLALQEENWMYCINTA